MSDSASSSYLDKLAQIASGLWPTAGVDESLLDRSTSSGQSEGQESAVREITKSLLLRLVNETYLSLPIIECRSIYDARQQHLSSSPINLQGSEQHHQHEYDACFVDWSQSRLVQEPSSPKNEKYQLLLSSLLATSPQKHIENYTAQNIHTSSFGTHLNFTNNITANTNFGLSNEYNLAKLTYLSLSSVLSICGLLINLLIILIIIVNARQKSSSVIRSSSNTGHNNLLLAQLTVTGFLIAIYVLVDNIYIFNQMSPPLPEWPIKYRDKFSFCQLTANPPSPLTTFLPPTPFVSPQLPCSVSEDQRSCLSEDGTSFNGNHLGGRSTSGDEIQGLTQQARAMVLMFSDEITNNEISHWPKSFFLESAHKGKSILTDLSEKVSAIFPVDYECRTYDTTQRKRRQTRSSTLPEGNNSFDLVTNYSGFNDQEGCKVFFWFASGLLSLLMNVIASVHFWTAAALAYDRYSAIAHPLQYLRPIHASRTRAFLILSWVLAMVLNLLFPIMLTHINTKILWTSREFYGTRVESYNDDRLYSWTDFGKTMEDYESERMQETRTSQCRFTSVPSDNQNDLGGIYGIEALMKLGTPWSDLQGWLSKRKLESSTFDKKVISLRQRQDSFIDLISTLVELTSSTGSTHTASASKPDTSRHPERPNENLYVALVLTFSLFSFVVIILVPLLLITVCNISIYRIVKVHERRISFSSVNNVPTASAVSLMQQPFLKRDYSDNRSDLGSVTSSVMAKLKFKKSANNTELSNDHEANQACLAKQCNQSCEKTQQNRNENNMTNRSKRLVARQDSYKILEKLMNDERGVQGKKLNDNSNYNMNIRQECSSHESVLTRSNSKSLRLKRKNSDYGISNTGYRFGSCRFQKPRAKKHHDVDTCSFGDLNLDSNQEPMKRDSSFIKQLKMVGLSFVGIAVRDHPTGSNGKPLNRSTSCSLASLHSNCHQHWNRSQCYSSLSRSSAETSGLNPKPPYLDAPVMSKNEATANQKIFDCDSITTPQPSEASASYQPIHIRFPVAIGTKSGTFNVVFWLVLTMLILTLPHYLLVTVDQIIKLYSSNNLNSRDAKTISPQSNDRLADYFSSTSTDRPVSPTRNLRKQQDIQQTLIQFGSIWISCLCRILFLSMVPLNAWLYGVRSRTLRLKIGMIFKRYISRRQASIEINQRQRSISSARSRESSSLNNMHQFFCGHRFNCSHYHANLEAHNKMFERCNDIKLINEPPKMSEQNNCSSSPVICFNNSQISGNSDSPKKIGTKARSLSRSNGTIRFFFGDEPDKIADIQPTAPGNRLEDDKNRDSISTDTGSLIPVTFESHTSHQYSKSHDDIVSLFVGKTRNENQLSESNSGQNHVGQTSPTFGHLIEFDKMIEENRCLDCSDDVNRRMSIESTTESLASSLSYSTQVSQVRARKYDIGSTENQQFCGLDRRPGYLSANEVGRSSSNDIKRPIRKSSSGFTFLITDADQESHIIELDPTSDRELVKENETIVQFDGVDQTTVETRVNTSEIEAVNWWQKLRFNLSKLLLNATASILAANFEECNRKRTLRDNCDACLLSGKENCSTSSLVDPSTLLLRQCSLNGSTTKKRSRKRYKNGSTRLRGSKTMNNLESKNTGDFMNTCHCCRHKPFCSDNNHSDGKDRSIHLQPPNLLKIMFTSDNHPVPYLGPSALSPIKECSSNHSYASSQSSLNNHIQAASYITRPEVSTKVTPSPL